MTIFADTHTDINGMKVHIEVKFDDKTRKPVAVSCNYQEWKPYWYVMEIAPRSLRDFIQNNIVKHYSS